jgi:hypothetical protein
VILIASRNVSGKFCNAIPRIRIRLSRCGEELLLAPAVAEGDVAVCLTMGFDKADDIRRKIEDPLWEGACLVIRAVYCLAVSVVLAAGLQPGLNYLGAFFSAWIGWDFSCAADG